MADKRAIAGWTAHTQGKETGKVAEVVIEEIKTLKGQSFLSFHFYKPFQSNKPENAGQWIPGHSFSARDLTDLVDRINWCIQQGFTDLKGQFVFQGAQPQFVGGFQAQPQQAPYQAPMASQPPYQQQQYGNPSPAYAPPVQPPQGYPQQAPMFQPQQPPVEPMAPQQGQPGYGYTPPKTNSGW